MGVVEARGSALMKLEKRALFTLTSSEALDQAAAPDGGFGCR